MPTVFESPADLQKAVGQTLGESAWLEVTQERVNLFADATDDHTQKELVEALNSAHLAAWELARRIELEGGGR